ncbi:MAG TPA: spore cortex-lytic enzyme [Clostridiaceae bacterium]|jgi:N-acetylmuramoyl-L-alanine amidase|nr:spore cortex-lytic enzyme [Clostridiaceae bacterium]
MINTNKKEKEVLSLSRKTLKLLNLLFVLSFTIGFLGTIIYFKKEGKDIANYETVFDHAKNEEDIDVLSRRGSRGQEVISIQRKLKRWGYYKGNVDGIYGPQTESAVRYFQRKNGLRVDGIAGPQTLRAMGIFSSASSNQGSYQQNVELLARAIYGEARGEPYTGKVAVAAVIINRTKDSRFPKTIAGVIYQPGAFDAVADGQINLQPDQSSYNAARDALNGWDPTYGCLYYYNPQTATNKWIRSLPIVVTIGKHVFCKSNT